MRRWLKQQGRDQDLAQHLLEQQRYVQVIELLNATREKLREVYSSALPPEQMRAQKAATLGRMKEDYAHLKGQWGGRAPFDAWFGAQINNAHLASIATYYTCVPGFQRELATVGGNLPAFYARVRQLAKMDRKQRDELVCGETID